MKKSVRRAMLAKHPECATHNIQACRKAVLLAWCHTCHKEIHVTLEEVRAATPPSSYAIRLAAYEKDLAENGPERRRS